MLRLAVCVFGNHSPTSMTDVHARLNNVFNNITSMSVFHVPNENLLKSLWLTANEKRKYELHNKLDFQLCLGINISELDIVDHINLDNTKMNSVEDFLYYSKGSFQNNCTSIHLNGFYSSSLVFDRASEFVFAEIDSNFLEVKTLESMFYYYLKYINVRVRCVNYENSSLFKRSA